MAGARESLAIFCPVAESRLKRGLRATVTGLAANLVLAGGKLVAGTLGHSHALIADGLESMADLVSSLLVWRGLVVAAEPADEDHPYGHGKAEPIAAAGVSTLLLLAALWIGVGAVRGILHPHPSPAPFTLAVLVAAVLIKEGLFRFVRQESAAVGSTAMHADAWHHRSDAITSLAAGLGISIALIGGPGFGVADDVAALVAATIIAWNGWQLLRRALAELMDRSPSREVVDDIRAMAARVPGVERIEKCLARKMGYQYYVEMHVQVNPEMTVQRSHQLAHEVKNQVTAQLPFVRDVLVHIEPAQARS